MQVHEHFPDSVAKTVDGTNKLCHHVVTFSHHTRSFTCATKVESHSSAFSKFQNGSLWVLSGSVRDSIRHRCFTFCSCLIAFPQCLSDLGAVALINPHTLLPIKYFHQATTCFANHHHVLHINQEITPLCGIVLVFVCIIIFTGTILLFTPSGFVVPCINT
jgi:hypothetical protein